MVSVYPSEEVVQPGGTEPLAQVVGEPTVVAEHDPFQQGGALAVKAARNRTAEPEAQPLGRAEPGSERTSVERIEPGSAPAPAREGNRKRNRDESSIGERHRSEGGHGDQEQDRAGTHSVRECEPDTGCEGERVHGTA